MLFYEEKAQENAKSMFTKEMVEHKIVRLVIFERNQKCINAAWNSCNLFLINSNLKIKIGKRLTHQKKNLKGGGGGGVTYNHNPNVTQIFAIPNIDKLCK